MDKKKKILIPLLVALLGIFTFWYAISNYKSLFIFSGDNLEQEYLFILGGIKRIKAWNFSVYDWSAGTLSTLKERGENHEVRRKTCISIWRRY